MAELGRGERMHLIGTSLGGRVAAWLAVRHADRVDRLVLESPAAFRPADAPPLSALTPEQLRRALYGNPEVAPPTDDPLERQRQLKVVGRLTQGVMWDADLERGLGEIEAATLVLFGTQDGLMPPEMGRVYKERIPEAYPDLRLRRGPRHPVGLSRALRGGRGRLPDPRRSLPRPPHRGRGVVTDGATGSLLSTAPAVRRIDGDQSRGVRGPRPSLCGRR